jgi:phage nucleotide-binding protein
MAINLKMLSKPSRERPIILTIFSEAGLGKTTLAAMFPKPVFIRTEDGTTSLQGNDDVALFPLAASVQDVLDAIEALATQPHDYKTVVLDSITQLADMIEREVVAADPKAKTIVEAAGGFGKAYIVASEKHRMIREWIGALAYEKGMNVVFIGHADVEKVPSPDMDEFSRYTVRMHKKALPHYTDNVDLVGFIRLKTFTVTKGDKVQAKSTGEREIICFPVASNVSKNRFGISEPLPFTFDGGNPFYQFAAK